MSVCVYFDPDHSLRRVVALDLSANTTLVIGRPDVVINPQLPAGEVFHYWREDAGTVRDMSAAEVAQVDAEDLLAAQLAERDGAKGRFDTGSGMILRAVADITKDELNLLRQWLQDFKAVVAGSNNLGQFAAGVAGLPDTPDRTLSQLRNAIRSRIDAGGVD